MRLGKSLGMLAIAIGCEERCRDEIDKIYNSNTRKYIMIFEKSGVGKTRIFDKYTVTTSEYIKKCISIIIDEDLKGSNLVINRLIKKGYKAVYTYMQHCRTPSFEEFTVKYNDKMGGLEKLSGIYLDYCYYVIHYLSIREGKPILKTPFHKGVIEQFDFTVVSPRIGDVHLIEQELDVSTDGYEKLIEILMYNNHLADDVSMIFEDIRLTEEKPLMGNPNLYNANIREELAKRPLSKITNIGLILLELFGVGADVLREAKIDKGTVTSIAKYVKTISNVNDIPERESEIVMLLSLILYALAKEYENVRTIHYENAKTTLLKREMEQERIQSELERNQEIEIKKLKQDLEEAKDSSNKKDHELKEYKNITRGLENNIKKLTNDLMKETEKERELQFLREYYFDSINNKQELDYVEGEETAESIAETLTTIKGVIVGGHQKFHAKLKEYLPTFSFISPDDLGRNLNYIVNMDIVYYISTTNNHGIYKKVMPIVRNSEVPMTYLTATQNIEMVLKEIQVKAHKKGIKIPATIN